MTKAEVRWYSVYGGVMGSSFFILLSVGEFLLAIFAAAHCVYAFKYLNDNIPAKEDQ